MQRNFTGPGVAYMAGTEVNKRSREQKQAHAHRDAPPEAFRHEDGRHREQSKPDDDHPKRGLVKANIGRSELAQVQPDGGDADRITADPDGAAAPLEREMQQHRRQQVQDREAQGGDGVRERHQAARSCSV
jgi:hypothetical protein